jgi:hypothetical protein
VAGCDEPAKGGRGGRSPETGGVAPSQAGDARTPAREPVLSSRANKAVYDRGTEGMRAMNALRGSVMSEALATDLGYKCADLKSIAGKLADERDPIVWRLRTDIDRTCGFDVPIACARFEVQVMEKKRATESGATLDRECAALKLAIGDTGSLYLQNPAVLEVGDKYLTYCGSTDSVRRVP